MTYVSADPFGSSLHGLGITDVVFGDRRLAIVGFIELARFDIEPIDQRF